MEDTGHGRSPEVGRPEKVINSEDFAGVSGVALVCPQGVTRMSDASSEIFSGNTFLPVSDTSSACVRDMLGKNASRCFLAQDMSVGVQKFDQLSQMKNAFTKI